MKELFNPGLGLHNSSFEGFEFLSEHGSQIRHKTYGVYKHFLNGQVFFGCFRQPQLSELIALAEYIEERNEMPT